MNGRKKREDFEEAFNNLIPETKIDDKILKFIHLQEKIVLTFFNLISTLNLST